jgi:hypothetical protein
MESIQPITWSHVVPLHKKNHPGLMLSIWLYCNLLGGLSMLQYVDNKKKRKSVHDRKASRDPGT